MDQWWKQMIYKKCLCFLINSNVLSLELFIVYACTGLEGNESMFGIRISNERDFQRL